MHSSKIYTETTLFYNVSLLLNIVTIHVFACHELLWYDDVEKMFSVNTL